MPTYFNWHDYKPGDVQTKLHRLFRHSEEVDNMSVQIGEVATFPGVRADKAQAIKVLEEASEVRQAWTMLCGTQTGTATCVECTYKCKSFNDLVGEIADTIQACMNLAAALGVDDMRGAMAECERRNRERGRL